MMPVLRILSIVVATAIVVGVLFPLSEPVSADVPVIATVTVRAVRSTDSSQTVLIGVAGCSAASCHGGREVVGGEYTHWATRDVAHRRAYNVLLSDASRIMATKLGIAAAHKETRCLACHSMDAGQTAPTHGPRFAIEFGVACESCHGAAGQWLARHTERSWKQLSDHQKSEFGFRNLRSLDVRADACIACHVGSPHATVDHDLIAAGHPRLTFELSAYQAMMPKHWPEATALQRQPEQELKLWMLGQIKSAKAAADIAVFRAEATTSASSTNGDRASSRYVMPDLAEFDCHACHHDLAEKSWRGRLSTNKKIGEPQWGSWSIVSATWLAHESKSVFGLDQTAAESSLAQWTLLMQNSKLRGVPTGELVSVARRASIDLAAWSQFLESHRSDESQVRLFLKRSLAINSDDAFATTWDGQTQRYLAVVAAHQTLRDLIGHASSDQFLPTQPLTQLQELLKFPLGFATPRDYQAERVQQLFRQLQQ